MSPLVVFQQMLIMVILMMVGFVCYKINIISSDSKKVMSSLVVNVFNPALLVASVSTNTAERSVYYGICTVLVGAAMYVILIALAHLICHFALPAGRERNIRHLMYIFANTGFIGIPVVRAVLGSEYVVYCAIISLEFCLIFYTYGYRQISDTREPFTLQSLKKVVNVGTIAGVASIVIFFAGIPVHTLIATPLTHLGNVTTPLSMMITGVTMAEQPSLRAVFGDKRLYGFDFVKMLLIPAGFAFLLKLVPVPEVIRQLILIVVSLPVASMPLMLILDRGWDARSCSNGAIQTNVLSVITIPLIVLLYFSI